MACKADLTMKIYHHYNGDHLPSSAEAIVPDIMRMLNPETVVDVGCGLGQWLSVFKRNGVLRVTGIDGKHVPKDRRMVDPSEFVEFDFNDCAEFVAREKYDLLLSLEVAEHLPADKAGPFVNMLTSLSDTIVFSAAVPGQTGENHANEQYPDYWFRLFAAKGYCVFDPFRKKYWNSSVNWWYSQNMYLLLKGRRSIKFQADKWDGNVYIHPRLLEMYATNQKNMDSYGALFIGIARKLRKSLFGR